MNGTIECAIIGRLGQDPDLRTAASGKPWMRLSLAVGRGDTTQWVTVAVFDDLAKGLIAKVKKSDRMYIEGRLTLQTWEKNGEQRAGLNVAAWRAEPLSQIGRQKPKRGRPQNAVVDSQEPIGYDLVEDAIPF